MGHLFWNGKSLMYMPGKPLGQPAPKPEKPKRKEAVKKNSKRKEE